VFEVAPAFGVRAIYRRFPQGAPKAVLKHAHSKRFARSGDVHGGPPIRAIR